MVWREQGGGSRVVRREQSSVEVQWSDPAVMSPKPAEIKMLVAVDRSPLFSGGLTVAGVKCTALRDTLLVNEQNTLDLKTKVYDGHPVTFAISIAKTPKGTHTSITIEDTHTHTHTHQGCDRVTSIDIYRA